MSTIRTPPLLVTVAALLTLGVAAPATASSSQTTASVTVDGGVLSITAPASSGELGSSPDGGTISGRLGQVQVEDDRNAAAGSSWVASVTATDFASSTGPSLPAQDVGYVVGEVSTTGIATLTSHDPDDLNGMVPVLSATEVAGDNSATWNPTLTVDVPDGAPAGVYTTTITHSVV